MSVETPGCQSGLNKVYIENIGQHLDQDVTLRGWLYNKRSSGKLHFLQLRDGTGVIQCVVFKGDVSPEVFEAAGHVSQESSIEVTGMVKRLAEQVARVSHQAVNREQPLLSQ